MREQPKLPVLDPTKGLFVKGGPFDKDYEYSLLNMIPEELLPKLEEVPHKFLLMNEAQLEMQCQPDVFVKRLRQIFWDEYRDALQKNRRMKIAEVVRKIGYPAPRLYTIFENPKQFAYILSPPATYDEFLSESLHAGMRRLRGFLDMDVNDENGQPKVHLIKTMLQIVQFLDIRKHGAPVQRTQSLNLQMHGTTGDLAAPTAQPEDFMSVELDEKIKELEAKIKSGPLAEDASFIEVDK